MVLDFYADWCGPCKVLFPRLKEHIEKHNDNDLVKINIDNYGDLAQAMKVTSIPHVFKIKDGEVIDSFVGNPPDDRLN